MSHRTQQQVRGDVQALVGRAVNGVIEIGRTKNEFVIRSGEGDLGCIYDGEGLTAALVKNDSIIKIWTTCCPPREKLGPVFQFLRYLIKERTSKTIDPVFKKMFSDKELDIERKYFLCGDQGVCVHTRRTRTGTDIAVMFEGEPTGMLYPWDRATGAIAFRDATRFTDLPF